MMENMEIYQSEDGALQLSVPMQQDTVWLSQAQMAQLFGTKRPAITKHLGNIFKAGELAMGTVCSNLEHTAADGKTYKTQFYNLDAIISVGYRVNSVSATRFRQWATQTLKQHLVQGYFGEPAYPTVESKAAHLLYFVVKNHPFTDGNKRSGAFLFVDFLHRNGRLFNKNDLPVINDTGLAALTLLVAESGPKQKETLIRLIMTMLANGTEAK